ncbi:MAG: PqqD family protein [Lachnospiraceae bacterium]|nr:PqqD family protein [Lachnospiraceae bacterium]
MKLKEGFLTHEACGEQIMVATGRNQFSGMVRSNATAAYIVDQLKEETDKEKIIEKMLERYDAPRSVIEPDVEKVLGVLRSIGALEE